jgi:hypothetical protein
MRGACPDQRKRTHKTGQAYLGEAPSLRWASIARHCASARPNPAGVEATNVDIDVVRRAAASEASA